MVSGLSMPIGYKNCTLGGINAPVNSILASRKSHSFIGVNEDGQAVLCKTTGNPATHVILRGSKFGPNYRQVNVMEMSALLNKHGLNRNIMIDCSHGNSKKDYKNQHTVVEDIIKQINFIKKYEIENNIIGLMIESNINEGSQELIYNKTPEYGISITDSCIDIEETHNILMEIYNAL
jgi:3-deoxy-7-phosphoheptulonate synthase